MGHPGWCDRDRCTVGGLQGGHRSAPQTVWADGRMWATVFVVQRPGERALVELAVPSGFAGTSWPADVAARVGATVSRVAAVAQQGAPVVR